MAKQCARGASSVLDALNSGDELSSDNNESDECDYTNEHGQGVTNSQKRCTDFKIFGFYLKISLIFHKISLAKG